MTSTWALKKTWPAGPHRVRSGRHQSPLRHRRRGATLVEAAIVLFVFVTLVMGTFDVGLAVWHHNTLSDAARQVTREAIVRGEFAAPRRTAWGPAAYNGTAADTQEIAQTVRPTLVGLDPSRVSVAVTWPDGSNKSGKRVQCTVSTTHQLIFTRLFTNSALTLSATSTMHIAH